MDSFFRDEGDSVLPEREEFGREIERSFTDTYTSYH